ncbi:VanZ family protein [Herbaspirillum sp. GCM10030257]|uniref:VanZ family protein n=1 Tax=Herbaspirillum sp. GCM10030257 TaxID=3273393 RepID=UPI003622FE4A
MRMSFVRLMIDDRYHRLRFIAALLIYLAVLVFGSIPGARTEVGEFASGLILHFITYSVIAFLLFTGFRNEYSAKGLTTVVMIALMGALDEYVQTFLPYRRGAIGDWYVDASAGILMSTLLWICLETKRRRVRTP